MPMQNPTPTVISSNGTDPAFIIFSWGGEEIDHSVVEKSAAIPRSATMQRTTEILSGHWHQMKDRLESQKVVFEINLPDGRGGCKRAGIPTESGDLVTERHSEIFVRLVPSQPTNRRDKSNIIAELASQPVASVSTHMIEEASSTVASYFKVSHRTEPPRKRDNTRGRPSNRDRQRKNNYSTRRTGRNKIEEVAFQPRRHASRGLVSCKQCTDEGVVCKRNGAAALICTRCAGWRLPCTLKPTDAEELERILRFQNGNLTKQSAASSLEGLDDTSEREDPMKSISFAKKLTKVYEEVSSGIEESGELDDDDMW